MKTLFKLSLAIILIIPQLGQSQNKKLTDVTISGYYNITLAKFFDKVSKEHKVVFSFESYRTEFSKVRISNRYSKTPLTKVLNKLAREYKFKYTVDAAGIIQIHNGDGLADPNAFTTYTGKATRSNFSISGKVTERKSGESLPAVNINVKATFKGTSSNLDGFFTLQNVPTDTSTILFSFLGYQKLEIKLNPKLKTTNMNIKLAATSLELDEIVIKGYSEDLIQVNEKVSMIKLTPAKIGLLPNLGEADIFRAFQLLPGVSAANENSAGLYIRGGTPDQALVTYDGFTVYHVDHLFGFYSAFNSNAIKDVNLYKGGFESKFGGRVSGVAEITGKDGNQNNFNIGGSLSLLSANIFTELPIGDKVSMLFAARRSWQGPIYNKIFDTFGPEEPEPPTQSANRPGFSSSTTEVASYFYDLNGKITFRPTNKDVISLSVYNGKDNLDNSSETPSSSFNFGDFSSSTSDLTEWGNTGASLKWARQWSSKLYINNLLSYSSYFSNRDRTSSRTITPSSGDEQTIKTGILEENLINDISFKSDWIYQVTQNHSLEFGTHLSKLGIGYEYSQNDTIPIIERNDEANIYAFYLQDKARLFNQKLLLTYGLRSTYYNITEQNYFEPRISATYMLTDNIAIKAAAGRYYQFAKRVIREDVLQGSKDFWVMADGNSVPVLTSSQLIAGFNYNKNGFVLDVEGYYKKLEGLSEYSLRFTTEQGGITYSDSFFEGTGSTLGIDFLVQKNVGNYTGWVGYTLSKTLHNFPDFQENDFYASNDVTNEFKVVNLYKLGHWDFSLTWIYATGKPYTEPTGGYSVTLLDDTEQSFISVSDKNTIRFPDYHRLDAGVTYSWHWKSGGRNSISTSLFNLYDRENIWYKEFQIEDDNLIETNINYLGFTPNLTLTLNLR